MTAQAIDYGVQFADLYDEIFPPVADDAPQVAALAGTDDEVIEFGAGTGRIALPLARRVRALTAVDLSHDMLERLAARRPDDLAVQVRSGDVRTYRDDHEYDVVLCLCGTISMLDDAADQAAAFRTFAEHVRPGGTVVVETHHPTFARAMHRTGSKQLFFSPYPGVQTGLLSYSELDGDRWTLRHTFIREGEPSPDLHEYSRLTTPDELDEHARAAGLEPVSRAGDAAGTPLQDAAPMVVCRYRAP